VKRYSRENNVSVPVERVNACGACVEVKRDLTSTV